MTKREVEVGGGIGRKIRKENEEGERKKRKKRRTMNEKEEGGR